MLSALQAALRCTARSAVREQQQRQRRRPASAVGRRSLLPRRASTWSMAAAGASSVQLAESQAAALVEDAVVWANQHGLVSSAGATARRRDGELGAQW